MSQRGEEGPLHGAAALGAEEDARTSIASLTVEARALEGRGDHDGAVRTLQKAALIAEALGDRALVGDLLVQCGEFFCTIGEFRMATRFFVRAREIARESPSEELKAEVYRGFGQLYKARGDFASASTCFDRALERLESSTRHRSVRRTLLDLAEIYLKQGRSLEASHLLERAEKLPAENDFGFDVRVRMNRGRLAHLEGDGDKAVAEYEEAARLAQVANRVFEREIVAIGLADLYLRGGRLDAALLSLREALALSAVAFASEPLHPVERARFERMGLLLRAIADSSPSEGPGVPHPLQVEETIRLHDAHPFVLTGQAPPYRPAVQGGQQDVDDGPFLPEPARRQESSPATPAPKY